MATTAVGSTSTSGTTTSSSSSTTDAWASLKLDDYFKLILSGLQNQDPTQPTDTSTILNQVSQLVNVESTRQLQNSLSSVALGQTINNATNLVNKNIQGLDAKGNKVSGVVSSVSIADSKATLNVKASDGTTSTVPLANVSTVNP